MKAEHTERAAMLVKVRETLPKFLEAVALPSHQVVLVLKESIGQCDVIAAEAFIDAETVEKLLAALERLIVNELELLGVEG